MSEAIQHEATATIGQKMKNQTQNFFTVTSPRLKRADLFSTSASVCRSAAVVAQVGRPTGKQDSLLDLVA
jgi:hypothetical protein